MFNPVIAGPEFEILTVCGALVGLLSSPRNSISPKLRLRREYRNPVPACASVAPNAHVPTSSTPAKIPLIAIFIEIAQAFSRSAVE